MRYLIAGGGTGGHIVPALNIANELSRIDADAHFKFIGTQRGLEIEIVPKRGYKLELIDIKQWKGIRCSLKNFWHSVAQMRKIIDEYKPDCGIGTGGYVSAPLAPACRLKGIPIFWQEQNTYPGLATKLASLFAKRIFLGFDDAKQYLWRKRRAIYSGNPVFIEPSIESQCRLRKKFALEADKFTIFLTGGSQGASALNETFLKMIREWGLPQRSQAIWQCGKDEYSVLAEIINRFDEKISLHPFIEDMSSAYGASDLIICRAGASTLAETAVVGIPAILIPFPYAAMDHQRKNARSFVQTEAAMMIDQNELTPSLLFATISDLIDHPDRLHRMASAMKSLGKPNATEFIAKNIYDYVNRQKN
ncbi:undecaprenyldiphospho-muramoylpentapeptide beta-N-acetylglucosaminyltransferase [bacterium]|nr:undecaprenyldiphospho-muramoylpentapeptide beta-N-acetylglucosaminyltransferase [bacterium]